VSVACDSLSLTVAMKDSSFLDTGHCFCVEDPKKDIVMIKNPHVDKELSLLQTQSRYIGHSDCTTSHPAFHLFSPMHGTDICFFDFVEDMYILLSLVFMLIYM
jgi:hypothetical protein